MNQASSCGDWTPSERDREAFAAPDQLPGGEGFCGVAAAVATLGDAWTLLIVRDLAERPRRFGQLQASTGISARVLTDRLRAMAAAGLVTRTMYPEVPPRVEYTLTEKGHGAVAVVDALRAYGERWLRPAAPSDASSEPSTACAAS